MRKMLLFFGIFCGGVAVGQGSYVIGPKVSGGSYSYTIGYQPTALVDTVPVMLLVTTCPTCYCQGKAGFAVRRRFDWVGECMPPMDCSPYWKVEKLLGPLKVELPEFITVWDYKLSKN